jgi:antitoxin (DNA-binding transcriptional repressor) of toxin-antitoxin stability system
MVIKERSVAIAQLKAHLSAEIRRVKAGESITILDHKQPVARLVGITGGSRYVKRCDRSFQWRELPPLLTGDVQSLVDEERADSW